MAETWGSVIGGIGGDLDGIRGADGAQERRGSKPGTDGGCESITAAEQCITNVN